MKRSEVIHFLILRTIGNFLLLFALFGVGATFGPALYFEVQFHVQQAQGVHYVVAETPQGSSFGSLTNKPRAVPPPAFSAITNSSKEKILIPKDTQFDVLIPKIGANAKVFPNVAVEDPNIYLPILQQGVAQAKGSVFPGMKGTTYLFAHSTDNFWDVGRYNAVFYLLKDLTIGDDVVIFFENHRYNYIVTKSQIVDPSDTQVLENSQKSPEQVVLQTCWPPGTTWKRLLVFAKPK